MTSSARTSLKILTQNFNMKGRFYYGKQQV